MSDLITPQELQGQHAAPQAPLIIDVRRPEEYAAGHIAGALNIPADQVPERLAELPCSRPVVTY
jgi:rhodanese-related sulfurtransferase